MNPLRGEVPLVLGERRLTLKMGVNALCAAEPVLGKKTRAILDDLEDSFDGPAMDTIRVMIWAGLRRHHPDVHLIEVGEMIEEFGAPRFLDAILKGMKSAFGTAEDKDGANPPA
ncbi:hypothetical protein SAMN05518849_101542 [Sphingobium sp. AP50]|uniref:hypothetical protein n=1 Tax=Sphingobium sp. AP50 TaxID=1884369 RepID=UPI0008CA3DFD|nr:hypothetical protein [Sphingobium sp. AP50]SEI68207.1 hypothetical protein SAMN05518849_101542 [Sphingobium sp. AP50]